MSTPILTTDGPGPFINDRYVNSFKANTALTPGLLVKLVGTQLVDVCTGSQNETVLGVVWNNVGGANNPTSIITRGQVKVKSDNAVTAGDFLVAGSAAQAHSIGPSLFVTGTSGAQIVFARMQALDTQATAGTAFLAQVF